MIRTRLGVRSVGLLTSDGSVRKVLAAPQRRRMQSDILRIVRGTA
jgi:hypothetical protein